MSSFITRLNDYIEECRDKHFKWNEHDCLTFTNEGFKRMYGKGFADDWLGTYYEGNRHVNLRLLQQKHKYKNVRTALDDRLVRSPATIGSLVLSRQGAHDWYIKTCFGLCLGGKSAFVGYYGLKFIPTESVDLSWSFK